MQTSLTHSILKLNNCNTTRQNDLKWRKTCTGLKLDLEHFNGPQTKFIGNSLYKHPVPAAEAEAVTEAVAEEFFGFGFFEFGFFVFDFAFGFFNVFMVDFSFSLRLNILINTIFRISTETQK